MFKILRKTSMLVIVWILWYMIENTNINGYINHFLNNFCIFNIPNNIVLYIADIFKVNGGIVAFILLSLYGFMFPPPFENLGIDIIEENGEDLKRFLMITFAVLTFVFGFILRHEIPIWHYVGATGTFMLFGATGRLLYDLVEEVGMGIFWIIIIPISLFLAFYNILVGKEILDALIISMGIIVLYLIILGIILYGIRVLAYIPVAIAFSIVLIGILCEGDIGLSNLMEFAYVLPTFGFTIFIVPPEENQEM